MGLESICIKKISDMSVGDTAYFSKTVNEANVMMFAQISGDYAPQHVNKAFGDTTMFHSRIAHGMLTVGLVGPMLTKLCGDASVTSFQNIRFRRVVLLNDTVNVKGVVTEVDLEKEEVTVDVECTAQNAQEGDRPFIIGTFKQSFRL